MSLLSLSGSNEERARFAGRAVVAGRTSSCALACTGRGKRAWRRWAQCARETRDASLQACQTRRAVAPCLNTWAIHITSRMATHPRSVRVALGRHDGMDEKGVSAETLSALKSRSVPSPLLKRQPVNIQMHVATRITSCSGKTCIRVPSGRVLLVSAGRLARLGALRIRRLSRCRYEWRRARCR